MACFIEYGKLHIDKTYGWIEEYLKSNVDYECSREFTLIYMQSLIQ